MCPWFSYNEGLHGQLIGIAGAISRVVLEGPTANPQDPGLHPLGMSGPACSLFALRGGLLCRAASVDVIFLGLSLRLWFFLVLR